MKLGPNVFEAAAKRHLVIALASLSVSVQAVGGPFSVALVDVAAAHLGWAEASAAVGRLYGRRSQAATCVTPLV